MEGSSLAPGHRGISIPTATAIVIANMVGTGVFTSLGFQLLGLHSAFSILLLWTVGGLVALCGALSYGEVSSRLPRSGGEYHFITRIYHPSLGFMAGWIGMTAGFCTPIALACIAFGKYLGGALGFENSIFLSILVAVFVTLVHYFGVGIGAVFQNTFTSFKLVILLGFATAAFWLGTRQPVRFLPQVSDVATIESAPFAIGLIYVMYAYSGWNAAVYIAGEIRDPRKNVPRALLLGAATVMACYVLLNAAFLYSTPEAAIRGKVEVGLIAGKHIFGETGGRIAGGLIAVGLISAISAMVWAGSRVAMTIGEDYSILRPLARKSAHGTPRAALLVQLVLIVLVLLTARFEDILLYTEFSLMVCLFLTVLGLFILRRRHGPNIGGVEAWGYPFTPAIFLLMIAFMLIHLLREKPMQSLAGIGGMAIGLVLYFCEPAAHRRALASRRFEE